MKGIAHDYDYLCIIFFFFFFFFFFFILYSCALDRYSRRIKTSEIMEKFSTVSRVGEARASSKFIPQLEWSILNEDSKLDRSTR